MAYDKKKLYKDAISLIKDYNLYFVEDLIALLPCHKATFYKLFNIKSDELNSLKSELNHNKVLKKVEIREKLADGKGVELIALYKLLATKDELQALTGNFHTVKQDTTVRNVDMTAKEAQEIAKKLDEKLDI